MTRIPALIKVKCASCRTAFPLTEEQYRELLKRSRVALNCPHCANDFEYNSVTTRTAENPAPSRPSRQLKADAPPQTHRAEASSEIPPVAAAPSPPAFPPPPFAPLGGGSPAPFNADPPAFPSLANKPFASPPAASFPQGSPTPSGGEVKKPTLNERWNRLPPWVQWTVIGAMIAVLAVIIFAIPTGGGKAPSEAPISQEPAPVKPDNDRSKSDTKAIEDKKPEPGIAHSADEKKAREKPAAKDKVSQEREP